MTNNNSRKNGSKSKIAILVLSCILAVFAIIVFVTDLILFYNGINFDNVLKIIEIVLSSSAAVSLSLTLSLNINAKIIKSKSCAKGSGLNISESQDVKINGITLFSGDKQNIQVVNIGAGIQEFIDVYNNVLLPHQMKNVEAIARKTYEELSKQPSDKEVNKDFVIKYIEDSKNISNETIQDIWVKLLVLETKTDDGVSKRTLDIIKNMTSKEALTFERIASLSTETNIIPKDFDNDGLDWNSISLLQDIGLIKSGDLTVNTITFEGKNQLYCTNDSYVIVLNHLNSGKVKFETPCFVLTSEGAQLKSALSIQMNDETIIRLGNKIKKRNTNKNIVIKAHKITSVDGNVINFDTKDLLS